MYVNILPAAFLNYELIAVFNLISRLKMRFRFNAIIKENSPRIDANASSSKSKYSFSSNSAANVTTVECCHCIGKEVFIIMF